MPKLMALRVKAIPIEMAATEASPSEKAPRLREKSNTIRVPGQGMIAVKNKKGRKRFHGIGS